MLHPKENNVLYCVQDVVFVFAKLQDGALRSGFSCNFAAIHLLPLPRRVNNRYMGNRRGDQWSPVHPFSHSVGGQWPPLRDKCCR